MMIDSIRALHMGMGGKKMKKDERIASIFTEDEKKKDETGRSSAVRAAKKAEERRKLAEGEDETLEIKPRTTAEVEKKELL